MRKALTLTADAEGNVFVAGPMRQDDDPATPLFVAKLDADGRLLWRRIIERAAPPWGFTGESAVASYPEEIVEDPISRDSVSPIMLEVEIDALSRKLTWQSKWQRALGAAIAAVLVTLSLAGVGAAHGPLAAATPPMRANLSEAFDTSELGRLVTPLAVDRTVYSEMRLVPGPSEADVRKEAADLRKAAADLRKETVALLSAAKPEDALPLATAYVAAAPDDAFPYLCLGAALLDLGRRDEARAAFRACAENAKRGSVSECRALAAN